MKKLIFLFILFSSSVFAQDKIQLRFPLSLPVGINPDSTDKLLDAKGIFPWYGHSYKFIMNFGEVPVVLLIPNYYEDKLSDVMLYSRYTDEAKEQLYLLKDAIRFIKATYYCETMENNIEDIKIGKDLMDNTIFIGQGQSMKITLDSRYDSDEGFRIIITFTDKALLESQVDKVLKDKKAQDIQAKKNL
jgi:hypothetical protein